MPGNQQQALMQCNCCGCVGGCFPYTCVGDVCTLDNIPWSIEAPNCTAIDGLSGVFSPLGGNSNFIKGICGPCVCYQSLTTITLPGKQRLEIGGGEGGIGPPPSCVTVDCSIPLKLYLGFDSSVPGCCNAALIVEMLNSELALNSGIPQKPNSISCIPQVLPADDTKFRQFGFDSCTCLTPYNQGAGFSALFNLSRITWYCKLGNHPATSLCYPFSKCCELFNCSLGGATLSL